MLIADAQVHIWAANTPERPWAAGRKAHRPVPFTKEDLLREMDAADVSRAVIVPPSLEGTRNDLGLEAARLHPDRFGVMGRFDLKAPDARSKIATWRDQPGMLGIRHSFNVDGAATEDWFWTESEAAGIPLMVSVYFPELHFIDQVAERHPKLKLAVDHLAIPEGKKDDEAFSELDKLLALAKRPNVAVKATAVPHYTNDSYPYRSVHPHLRRVYDAFGPKRIFWGTDFTRIKRPYRDVVTFTEEIPWLTAEDKEWIMGRGLCEWIGWKLP